MTSKASITAFEPHNPDFAKRVQSDFNKQNAMSSWGVSITSIKPGRVTMTVPFDARFTQQHGFLHAGIITSVLDTACGYAAFSLMEEWAEVLTVEFKTNFLAPAKSDLFKIEGMVIKPGKTLTICEGRAYGRDQDGVDRLIATMSATMMAVREQSKTGG
ncbi:MAG: PaaI family thioesterase [Pseudomonadota bacterium]